MDDKNYYPETIESNPLPNTEGLIDFDTSQSTSNDEFSDEKIKNQNLPVRRVAYEVLGRALNTKSKRILAEFKFTQSGAIQIGEYENGVSGDIRLTPNGITARDEAGLTTFALDGTTGNAVFKGELQAGSLITGIVAVGDNNIVIDGDARRMVFYDENDVPVILIGNG